MMASFRIFGKIFRQAIRPAPSLTRPPSAGFFRRTGEKSSAGRIALSKRRDVPVPARGGKIMFVKDG
ncbi:MAG: hypothetical protein C6P37_10235 [Caldibacillus debilis]|uniref:Uncharacterized protein n=1 Tax=Caldibacillus debilis TaxID=301148 RepID=A0A3E0K368_9BACI|nr:hypothetical protein [Bacillaceae bacterium]MBY6271651.1 hypothetical protein [Bacillaceae bacterium]REJ18136.1 MAG: hypothetical protein C6W57_04520 [Caldibacillus debilis]REJ27830.1 MAG: hypothetical protein C6P37_10235 [Caldibacillus debilis]REJ27961.1 MAG: hypothetical protein C6W56_09210 [Caldibacillus debilis]